jgi:hypothetical protein
MSGKVYDSVIDEFRNTYRVCWRSSMTPACLVMRMMIC